MKTKYVSTVQTGGGKISLTSLSSGSQLDAFFKRIKSVGDEATIKTEENKNAQFLTTIIAVAVSVMICFIIVISIAVCR